MLARPLAMMKIPSNSAGEPSAFCAMLM
jgi:hypothetical protein